MAGRMVIAEPAFEPGRVLADPRRRVLGENDAPGLFQQAFGYGAVSLDALDMQRVGVLADRDVEGQRDAGQVHVDLHLCGC